MENTIKNGAFLVSRNLFNSEIWIKPPYYLKLWIWILGKCNHKTTTKNGTRFERGECLVTLKETQEQTKYKAGWRTESISKTQAWNFYEDLRKMHMADTRKTTRGMVIKVINYDKYQNLSNYEYNNEGDKKTTRRQHMPNTINKNEKNEKNEKKNIYIQENKFSDFSDLSDSVLLEISKEYDVPLQLVTDLKDDMEVWIGRKKTNKYKNYKLALMSWVRREKKKITSDYHNMSKKRGGVIDARTV